MKNSKALPAEENAFSYRGMIIGYLAACIMGLLIIVTFFNGLIETHDKQLTNEICTLISEKMDTSIKYISTTVEEISTVLSCYEYPSLEEEYQQLRGSIENSDYISIGLVDKDGTVYATEAEKQEFEKWGLVESAMKTHGVTISEPYRSSMTGQLVFTMFSPIIRDGERSAYVFVTYPLGEIQNMANTDSLKDETEIWIMDGYSDNVIRCSGKESYLIGSWSNFKVDKSRIENPAAYEKWQDAIRHSEYTGSVTYILDGVAYTQVFKRIDFMPGWNVVVRIPSRSLSNTMQIFRSVIVAFAALLIVATLVLLGFTYRRETAEKKIFENLSTHDALTQILNRRAFDDSIQKYFSENSSPQCTFIFFDVDFFKQVNDNYGHETGDFILKEFARILESAYGSEGVAARYGGDEFVVYIRSGDKDAVNVMTKRFAEEIGKVRIEKDSNFRLHFSAGLACCPAHADDLDDLMKKADEALYRVKEQGRNNWKWYS